MFYQSNAYYYFCYNSPYTSHPLDDINSCDVSSLPESTLAEVEADAFWCLSKLFDGIQDHYTASQPGIQANVNKLKELIHRLDAPLYNHIADQGLEFNMFAFRWINCLLIREFPLRVIIRLWDTYMAEVNGFGVFHVYVCAALLRMFSKDIMKMKLENILMLLQSMPTQHWAPGREEETLLSEAFILKSLFESASSI